LFGRGFLEASRFRDRFVVMSLPIKYGEPYGSQVNKLFVGLKGEGMKDMAGDFLAKESGLENRCFTGVKRCKLKFLSEQSRKGSTDPTLFANLLTKQRDLIIFKKGLTKTEHSNSRTKPVVED